MKFSPGRTALQALLITTALVACTSKDQTSNLSGADTTDYEQQPPITVIEQISKNLPSPCEIPFLLESTGAEFNPSLVSEKDKASQYMGRREKAALNLGVYAADVGYLAVYNKTQDAIDFIASAKSLADNLGVVEGFDTKMIERFEKNIDNQDSLCRLIDAESKKVQDYLKGQNRTYVAALMITGSFVEGLYISTGIIRTYPPDFPEETKNTILAGLIRVILQQEESVDELLPLLNQLKESPIVTSLKDNLGKLQASYKALNIDERLKTDPAGVINDRNLKDITAVTEQIRNDITK
jgi:hypothetical protein